MAKSIFREKAIQPDDEMITVILSGSKELWDSIIAHVSETYPQATQEWKFYGSAWGWCLVLSSKKKKLVYLTPADKHFLCSFIFSENGRELSRQADFSADILKTIETGKDNNAGRTFDISVADKQSLELSKALLNIKAKS